MKRAFRSFRAPLMAAIALTLMGQGCLRAPSAEVTEASKPVTLTWWRVFDDEDTVEPVIAAYRGEHPNVNIQYRKLRFEEYETELLNALAEDRGPDILSLHNTWVDKYQSKLTPIPASYQIPVTTVQGTIKKERVTTLVAKQGLTVRALQTQYLDVVASDVVRSVASEIPQQGSTDQVFALPLFTDNLALFYNKDLLNAAGIAQPPADWRSFQDAVVKLVKQDAQGNIIQAGAALGTAKNVLRAADILSLLMMQNGTKMTDEDGDATFDKTPPELGGRTSPPGIDAVTFYTDFANPAKQVYTWNDTLPGSLEAFSQGKAAFFIGYAYNIPEIRARAPKLNFGIAKVPQIEGNPQINYANYWVEGVSRKSKNAQWAWDFIQYAASPEHVSLYLDEAKKPTAVRALINKQLEDIDLSVFATQLLTSKSWYHGNNEAGYETAFANLINAVLLGTPATNAIRNAVNQVNETYR